MRKPLRLYLWLAFGVCWGAGLLMLLTPSAWSGLKSALWLIAVGGGPAIAALAAAIRLGQDAVRDYLRRVFRRSWVWCVAAPALILAIHAAAVLGDHGAVQWPGLAPLGAAVLAATLADPGPIEELGWRGFLQPLLQNRLGPLRASLLVGLIWGLWHLPALVLPGFPQHDAALPLWFVIGRFVVQTTALSVVMGFALNRARGAVAPMMLMHWAANQGAAGHLWRFDPTAWTLALVVAAFLIAAAHLSGVLKMEPVAKQRLAPADA